MKRRSSRCTIPISYASRAIFEEVVMGTVTGAAGVEAVAVTDAETGVVSCACCAWTPKAAAKIEIANQEKRFRVITGPRLMIFRIRYLPFKT